MVVGYNVEEWLEFITVWDFWERKELKLFGVGTHKVGEQKMSNGFEVIMNYDVEGGLC